MCDSEKKMELECRRSKIKFETTANEKNLVLLDETEINWTIRDLRKALGSLSEVNIVPQFPFTVEKNAELPELKWIVFLVAVKESGGDNYNLQLRLHLFEGHEKLFGNKIHYVFKSEVLNDEGIVLKTIDSRSKTTDLMKDLSGDSYETGILYLYLTEDLDGKGRRNIWKPMEELPLRSDGSLGLRITLQLSANRVVTPFQKQVDPKLEVQEFWLKYLEDKAQAHREIVAGTETDVEIISKDGKAVQFHKELLTARSPAFKAMLPSEKLEPKSGSEVAILKLEDLSGQAVKFIHHFIYDGRMLPYLEKMKNGEGDDLGELEQWIYIASKYQFEDLIRFFDKLLRTLCNEENALELFKLCNRFSLMGAREDVREFIYEHPVVLNRHDTVFGTDEGKQLNGRDVAMKPSGVECRRTKIKVETIANEKDLVLLDRTEIEWKVKNLRQALESSEPFDVPPLVFSVQKNAELPKLRWGLKLLRKEDDDDYYRSEVIKPYRLEVLFRLLGSYEKHPPNTLYQSSVMELLNEEGIVCKTFGKENQISDMSFALGKCEEEVEVPLMDYYEDTKTHLENLPLGSDGSLLLRFVFQYFANRMEIPFEKEVEPKTVECWLKHFEARAQTGAEIVAGTETDVKLHSSDGKTVNFHKQLLAARSPVFEAMFRSNMLESQSGVVKLEDLSEQDVNFIHHFIYDGKMIPYVNELRNMEGLGELEQWLYIASKYQFEDLIKFFDKLLGTLCNEANALELFKLANQFSLLGAREDVRTFIHEHPEVLNKNII